MADAFVQVALEAGLPRAEVEEGLPSLSLQDLHTQLSFGLGFPPLFMTFSATCSSTTSPAAPAATREVAARGVALGGEFARGTRRQSRDDHRLSRRPEALATISSSALEQGRRQRQSQSLGKRAL